MTERESVSPELLAPAGNRECARAAVANGADAVYFGLPAFNARLRADNFTEDELPVLMTWLHNRGVRGYVAMNTLVFTGELEAAERQLRLLEQAGVDAIIVQDIGLARLARAVAPRLELHASTQMTLTSPEGLAFAAQLGLDRAVLARELSLRELRRFQGSAVPLEVFVHGALCVAYSGQCLTSESLGQRSANRGECAQACRLPYQLVVDGELRDLGDRRYLLSPQDLAAVDDIPALIELGVTGFKIEGRLKSPEYVAAVTRVYRKAIDAALAGRPRKAQPEDWYELEMTFSRGLFTGWLHGVDHQRLVGARFGKKRGAFAGHVVRAGRDWIELDRPGAALKPGDGIVIDTGGDTDHEQGGRIFSIEGRRLTFQRGRIDSSGVHPGDRIWKTSDPAMERRLRATFAKDPPPTGGRPIRVYVSGRAGEPLTLRETESGVTVQSEMPLAAAIRRPLTEATLTEQLGRLGGTGFRLAGLTSALEGDVILPLSELSRMRRALVAAVREQAPPVSGPAATASLADLLEPVAASRSSPPSGRAELSVLCRTMDQVRACLGAGVGDIHVDFEDIRGYAAAVETVREHGGSRIHLATPRIQKPGEAGYFSLIARARPHGVLIRNPGAVAHFRDSGLLTTGDFSLNVANPLTAAFYRDQGLQRLTISYDLNAGQVLDLLRAAPPEWFELTIHQHMPMFHMEHCVFAAFLSKGTSYLNCGRPCEKHSVALRDRVGMEHPLKADVGCRNTLFNAVPQSGAGYYDALFAAGLRRFRIELLNESPEETLTLLDTYRRLCDGSLSGDALWRQLKARAQLGVTRGTLG